MPPDDLNPVTIGSHGFIGEDGITRTPVGHIGQQESFSCAETVEPCPSLLRSSETVTLNVSTIRVSTKEFMWLRRWLGYMRLDYVWAYRRERKGHPRCRH